MKKAITLITCILVFPILILAQNGSWERQIFTMPTGKLTFPATCLYDGMVFLTGGQKQTGQSYWDAISSDKLWIFDPSSGTWDDSKKPMNTARGAHSMVTVNDKIYVIGGVKFPTPDWYRIASVEEYDPETDTWSEKSPLSIARSYCGVCVFNNKIFLFGGLDDDNNGLDIVEAYYPETDQWEVKSPMPTARSGVSVHQVGQKIYVFGGGIDAYDQSLSTVEIYDPFYDYWSTRASEMPEARKYMSTAKIGDEILFFGGLSATANTNFHIGYRDVLSYNPLSDSWKVTSQLPRVLAGMNSILFDGKILLIGGLNPTISLDNSLESFYPYIDSYTPNPYIYPKYNISSNYLDNNGSISIQVEVDSAEFYDYNIEAFINGLDIFYEDSLILYDDGIHDNSIQDDGIFGNSISNITGENIFSVDFRIINTSSDDTISSGRKFQFSSIGPLKLKEINFTKTDKQPDPGDKLTIKPVINNRGSNSIAGNVTAEIKCLDPGMAELTENFFNFGHISPGINQESTNSCSLIISDECQDSTILSFHVDIYSNNYVYWRDTFQIKVGRGFISGIENPGFTVHDVITIFPNPTSGIISITGLTEPAELKIYSIQGQLIKSEHQIESIVDLSDLTEGIYFLNLIKGKDRIVRKIVVNK